MKKLLLPDPEYFQSEDKQIVPLIKFYDWVIRNASPAVDILSTDGEITDMMKHIDISKIIIHEKYDAKLKKITKRFLMKKYHSYARQAEKEIAWHFLDIGPSTKQVPGLEKKSQFHVYLEDGYLRSKINE